MVSRPWWVVVNLRSARPPGGVFVQWFSDVWCRGEKSSQFYCNSSFLHWTRDREIYWDLEGWIGIWSMLGVYLIWRVEVTFLRRSRSTSKIWEELNGEHQRTMATLFERLQIYLLCTDLLLPKTLSNKADMMAYFPYARLYAWWRTLDKTEPWSDCTGWEKDLEWRQLSNSLLRSIDSWWLPKWSCQYMVPLLRHAEEHNTTFVYFAESRRE